MFGLDLLRVMPKMMMVARSTTSSKFHAKSCIHQCSCPASCQEDGSVGLHEAREIDYYREYTSRELYTPCHVKCHCKVGGAPSNSDIIQFLTTLKHATIVVEVRNCQFHLKVKSRMSNTCFHVLLPYDIYICCHVNSNTTATDCR